MVEKDPPPLRKKNAKRPPYGETPPPPHKERIVAKLYSEQFFYYYFPVGVRDSLHLPPPPPAGAHGNIRMHLCLIITIDRARSTLSVTVNTVCACVYFTANAGASPGFGRGGPRIFFSDLGICMSRSDRHDAHGKAMRIARGVRWHAPRENFLKRCNLVRFRVYFDQILSFFFQKMPFFI